MVSKRRRKKRRLVKDLTKVGRRVRAQRRKGNSPLWRRKALALWSKIVRRGGKCEACGVPASEKVLDAHHVLSKEKNPWLAFETINAVCLCKKCHKLGRWAAHTSPLWFHVWLKSTKPATFVWAMKHLFEEPQLVPDFRGEYERLKKMAATLGVKTDQVKLKRNVPAVGESPNGTTLKATRVNARPRSVRGGKQVGVLPPPPVVVAKSKPKVLIMPMRRSKPIELPDDLDHLFD